MFIGVASYARPLAFKLCLLSLVRARIVKGVIAAIDVRGVQEKERYKEAVEKAREHGLEVITDLSSKRRGFTNARNKVLDIAEEVLKDDDALVLYDDDYVCPGAHALYPALTWLKNSTIGLVGGRVVDLRRRIDPDFYLNFMPELADKLSSLTGFIFLNTKHGPRFTYYTLPLRALRVKVVKQGVRFDEKFQGTGYRGEDDFNLQIVKLGYKVLFEPRFWAFHLCLEYGGCRVDDITQRFYWKARNHVYFIKKHNLGTLRGIVGTSIIAIYALLHGPKTLNALNKGLKDGLHESLRACVLVHDKHLIEKR